MNALTEAVELMERLETPLKVEETEAAMMAFLSEATQPEVAQVQRAIDWQANALLIEIQQLRDELNRIVAENGLDVVAVESLVR